MSKYVNAIDLSDPSLVINTDDTDSADVFVDSQLWERDIDPADVVLPQALLTETAGYWAKREAAMRGAIGSDSPLIKKSIEFEKNALRLAGTFSRKALGIASANTFGSVTVGRG